TSHMSQAIASLLVPQAVTVINQNDPLNLSGNFTNAGNFYAVSTSAQTSNMVINALNIHNTQGAHISTVIPSAGLPGISGARTDTSLTLNAVHDIINSGTISSAGS